ncbi:acetylcholine receptor subunit alpha-like [Ruditapes philippinarum]|uniref:acetylcholine receptor subunit alpha-like n=1 Tax=Ruditapes philippinarum TaxID=129788 RepID=UPI00295AA90D|nr:acetylcholine receptor subunit alpha-like [Ruditapes philippinarum]
MIGTIKAETYEDVSNLRSTLLTSYNADMLPVNDQTRSLNINLSTMVFTMPEVDPVLGAIKMGIMVTQEWYDERLTWTPSDHNGTMVFSMKAENIWTPPLTVSNPVTFTLLDTPWMQATIMFNGKVMFTVGGIIQFSCSFSMKFWPFDKHICTLNLFPYGYMASRVTFSVPGTIVDTGIYSENGEWYLDTNSFDYELGTVFGMSEIVYSFKIARLSSFYMLTVILPINGIGMLTCLVFLLPSESGERVSYAITIMLSLAVFLTVTAEDLPKNSKPIPIICVYILFNLIICILGLLFVVLNLIIFNRTKKVKMAEIYKSIVRFTKRKSLRRKIRVEPLRKNSTAKINVKSREPVKVFEHRRADEDIEWKDVSDAIDKILFVLFVVVTYIPSIIILIYTVAASEYVRGEQ